MKNPPFRLRFLLAGGACGLTLGGIAPIIFGAHPFIIAVWAIVGWIFGLLVGYGLGTVDWGPSTLRRYEHIALGTEKVVVILSWVFAGAGIIALLTSGWRLSLMLSTAFFFAAAVYLTRRI